MANIDSGAWFADKLVSEKLSKAQEEKPLPKCTICGKIPLHCKCESKELKK